MKDDTKNQSEQDNGTKSSTPYVRRPPPPMRVAEPSDPIFSKPTVITFARNSMTSTESLEKSSAESKGTKDSLRSQSQERLPLIVQLLEEIGRGTDPLVAAEKIKRENTPTSKYEQKKGLLEKFKEYLGLRGNHE